MSVVLLCDLSGSMASEANGGRSCVQMLRDAAKDLLKLHPQAKLVRFSNEARVVESLDREEPYGGTNLASGFRCARSLGPTHTVVVSDGMPNDPEEAMAEARVTPGVISCVYVGPDDCKEAIAFMKRLAKVGAGVGLISDLRRAKTNLLASLESVLALPAPR